MRPLALAITASVCDGGPTIAIDLPGADPKLNATTAASQPQTTRAIAPAIRPNRIVLPGRGLLVVIEVFNARTSGSEIAVDIHQSVDPGLQAGPAKAGPGIKLQ